MSQEQENIKAGAAGDDAAGKSAEEDLIEDVEDFLSGAGEGGPSEIAPESSQKALYEDAKGMAASFMKGLAGMKFKKKAGKHDFSGIYKAVKGKAAEFAQQNGLPVKVSQARRAVPADTPVDCVQVFLDFDRSPYDVGKLRLVAAKEQSRYDLSVMVRAYVSTDPEDRTSSMVSSVEVFSCYAKPWEKGTPFIEYYSTACDAERQRCGEDDDKFARCGMTMDEFEDAFFGKRLDILEEAYMRSVRYMKDELVYGRGDSQKGSRWQG